MQGNTNVYSCLRDVRNVSYIVLTTKIYQTREIRDTHLYFSILSFRHSLAFCAVVRAIYGLPFVILGTPL